MQTPADRIEETRAFLEDAGWGAATITALPGDASTRRYARLALNGHRAMLMDQPQGAEEPSSPADASPEQRRALGYNAVARLAGADCGRYIAAANYLRSKGLSAPEIYAADTVRGFVLVEDLGDDRFDDALTRGEDEHTLYATAIDALAGLHTEAAPSVLPPDKPLFRYDETALLAEVDLMTEWFVPLALGRNAHVEEVEEHRTHWRDALRDTFGCSPVFVHRDYHAQNLMWLPAREGAARVGVIDFQDAVAGTKSYDLISLIEDARRDVPVELGSAMTQRYLGAMGDHGVDAVRHRAEMAVMAAQRNAKIAGIFSRLYKRDNKPRYLSYLPRVWGYLNRDLEHPALAPLKAWYDRVIPTDLRTAPANREQIS
ncbi:MAG: phosphotransferase [Rhizomicrobium sp.]|jgi:aminoglycoside/choline kinase family phosphotransferase